MKKIIVAMMLLMTSGMSMADQISMCSTKGKIAFVAAWAAMLKEDRTRFVEKMVAEAVHVRDKAAIEDLREVVGLLYDEGAIHVADIMEYSKKNSDKAMTVGRAVAWFAWDSAVSCFKENNDKKTAKDQCIIDVLDRGARGAIGSKEVSIKIGNC